MMLKPNQRIIWDTNLLGKFLLRKPAGFQKVQ